MIGDNPIGLGPVAPEKRVRLLVLEVDGVVRLSEQELGRPIRRPADIVIHDGAIEQIRRWKMSGGRVVCVGNAGDVALGRVDFNDMTRLLKRTHDVTGALVDRWGYCIHHPEAIDPEYARCWCRLPSPGLVIELCLPMAYGNREMYPPHMALFVGSSPEAKQCAALCGMEFQAAQVWLAAGKLLVGSN